MSFQDVLHDLDAGLPPRPPQPPAAAAVAHGVFQINTKVTDLFRLAHVLAAGGGDAGARVVRERIRRARAEVTRLARNTARRLADPAAAAAVGPNLAMDFQSALGKFQRVQERILDADRKEAAAARRAAPVFRPPSPPTYGSPIGAQMDNATAGADHDQQHGIQMQQHNTEMQQQQQQLVESQRTQELALLDNEITFNEALVEEREQEMCKIQQEIAEINEIFKDLAKLVSDQQVAIDIVESNTERAAMDTSKAEEQLSTAARAQETNSSTKCLLIAVFGLVMFIFALVFVA